MENEAKRDKNRLSKKYYDNENESDFIDAYARKLKEKIREKSRERIKEKEKLKEKEREREIREKQKEKYADKLKEKIRQDKNLLYRSKSYKDTTKLEKKIQFRQEDYLKNFKVSNDFNAIKQQQQQQQQQPQVQKKTVVYQEEECDCDECIAERKELEAITKRNNIITNIKSINEDAECDCDDCRKEKKTKLVKSKSFNVKSYTPAFGPPIKKYSKRNNYLKKDDNDVECNCESCLIERYKHSNKRFK